MWWILGAVAVAVIAVFAMQVRISDRQIRKEDAVREVRAQRFEARQRLVGAGSQRTVGVVRERYKRDSGAGVAERMGEDEAQAVLRPEPDNPRDPDAVRVLVFGEPIGYLSVVHARQYRAAIDLAAEHGELLAARVRARTCTTDVGRPTDDMNEFLLYLPNAASVMHELESAYAE